MMETDQSIQLWKEYFKNKDRETRNKLVVKYYHLVRWIVYNLHFKPNCQMEFDDLVSCGVFGLIDAVEKYDLKRNVKFETYAAERIKGAVIDSLRETDWLSRSIRKSIKALEGALNQFQLKEGRDAKDGELAAMMGISPLEVNRLLSYKKASCLFSFEDMEERFMYRDTSPERAYEALETRETIEFILKCLSERERFIILMHYIKGISLKSISFTLGLSEARISQIHKRSLEKLRSVDLDPESGIINR